MAEFKPQSMKQGQRNVLRSNDSTSLFNFTLSPGWSREEAETLRLALMKFGIGNWKSILESGCLPGKMTAQLNLQTQRMLGQQSTGEFANVQLDPYVIAKLNLEKQGPDILRKNGYIINSGAKLSREEVRRRIAENRANYGLSKEEIDAIVLPKPNVNNLTETKLKFNENPTKNSALANENIKRTNKTIEKKKMELKELKLELRELQILMKETFREDFCMDNDALDVEELFSDDDDFEYFYKPKELKSRRGRNIKRVKFYDE